MLPVYPVDVVPFQNPSAEAALGLELPPPQATNSEKVMIESDTLKKFFIKLLNFVVSHLKSHLQNIKIKFISIFFYIFIY